MSAPRLYVPGLDPRIARISLSEGESHHVMRVLRLRPGDHVRVFDGEGREWTAQLAPAERRGLARVEHLEPVDAAREPLVRVTLGAGILKGDHMDAVVRDGTMMGAVGIVPLPTDLVTVPQKAWQGTAALERWRRVAIASAKQCGRALVPGIAPPTDLEAVIRQHLGSTMIMFVEPSADASAVAVSDIAVPRQEALVLVGPEGGWSAGEVSAARAAGVHLVRLGPRTIRSDAMAAVSLAALWAVWKI
ncbi:MAG TPA: RsmE family RNA methyltransferase [Vicinamibacterales bacterium]|nr:RsmE family RNA methyltransferase [Vicinamibacterales bacterium]